MKARESYQDHLREELARRCERNNKYSLRAFARAIEVDAGTLSRILDGKQVPSQKLSQRIVNGLNLNPTQEEAFFTSVAEKQRTRNLQRQNSMIQTYKPLRPKPKDLSIDLYRVIADWYHTAILELTFVSNFDSNPRGIARALGISEAQAKLAVERLLELGLLEKKKGVLRKSNLQLTTDNKSITTSALRKNQRQLLERAIHSLENDPIETRSITSMTMAIDPKHLPVARMMIQEFNRALCSVLEDGKRQQVYNLEVALYPLQSNLDVKKAKEKSK